MKIDSLKHGSTISPSEVITVWDTEVPLRDAHRKVLFAILSNHQARINNCILQSGIYHSRKKFVVLLASYSCVVKSMDRCNVSALSTVNCHTFCNQFYGIFRGHFFLNFIFSFVFLCFPFWECECINKIKSIMHYLGKPFEKTVDSSNCKLL